LANETRTIAAVSDPQQVNNNNNRPTRNVRESDTTKLKIKIARSTVHKFGLKSAGQLANTTPSL
jgi:hypothetical protein